MRKTLQITSAALLFAGAALPIGSILGAVSRLVSIDTAASMLNTYLTIPLFPLALLVGVVGLVTTGE